MGVFPDTQFSAVLAARSKDPVERRRSMQRLAEAYYKPVYKHLRLKWRRAPDSAMDLAQDFFAKAISQDMFGVYDPSRSKFRTFIRKCLDNFVLHDEEARTRLKRGGNVETITFDSSGAEREIELSGFHVDPEHVFDREFARELWARSITLLGERLHALGKGRQFEAFRQYDLNELETRPSYAEVAKQLGVEVTTVTNWLHGVRAELRAIVLLSLKELTATDEEFRDEARTVLNIRV